MDRSGKTFGIIVLTIFTVILSLLFYRSEHREETTLMAALQPLKSLLVSPQTKHTATVIFVHGLGDTGHGWKPVADMFSIDPALSHVKWVLPHAPIRRVTANMGMEMPSWFDILNFDFDAAEDEAGMLQTVRSLNQLITSEVDDGVEPQRIILGGFSQGGAMSILTGLSNERKLGGVVALSAWLPLRKKFKMMTSEHVKSLPIFWGHGMEDPLIKPFIGQASVDYLKNDVGISEAKEDVKGILFKQYAGVAHSTNQKELDDLKAWIKKVVPQTES